MSSGLLSPPHGADESLHNAADKQKRPSDGEELRLNIAQLNLGEECLRKTRLLGNPGNQDYETYSLPVSRVWAPFASTA